jgi:hypothetical protein
VHVIWRDFRDENAEIYYKRSLDDGATWSEDIRLTNNPAHLEYPSIAVSGSNVHVVWMDYREESNAIYGEIYYKVSLNNGANWGNDTRLTNDPAVSWYPSIAVSDSNVHVVWYDRRDGNSEIYYKRSLDNGVNWSQDFRLTNNIDDSYSPSVGVSCSNVHVVWRDNRDGNDEIYYNQSFDNGTNWGTDKRLSYNSAESWSPSIAVSDSNVHLVWMDRRNGFNGEIYYNHSFDNGANWDTDTTRLTNDPAVSWFPSIAVSGSNVHVVWEDHRHGNNYGEIYYKRNATGNPTGLENIDAGMPKAFWLEQNYPNPFNPSTKINWQSPVSSWQTLKVYDVLGNEIATLVDEYKHAGIYEVEFQSSVGSHQLASGIYYYQLRSGDFIQTKKMLLIK